MGVLERKRPGGRVVRVGAREVTVRLDEVVTRVIDALPLAKSISTNAINRADSRNAVAVGGN
jgi:hypothetical protein